MFCILLVVEEINSLTLEMLLSNECLCYHNHYIECKGHKSVNCKHDIPNEVTKMVELNRFTLPSLSVSQNFHCYFQQLLINLTLMNFQDGSKFLETY